MVNNKKTAALVAVLSACLLLCGCSSGNQAADSAETESAPVAVKKAELTEEQKKAAEEAGISADRYCTDNTEITAAAENVLQTYYDGIAEENFEKFIGVFPEFYKKAIQEENKEYGETDDEYMKWMKQELVKNYGEDFYAFPEITSVLQINDESLKDLEGRVLDAFGTDVKFDDLYYVYFKQCVRGNLNKSSDAFEYCLMNIGGKYYLYDTYFEEGN